VVLWHWVQAAFTFACMGPGGSGLAGALGAWVKANGLAMNKTAGR